jgi:flagellar biosynthesis chaperone FliJ
VVDKQIEAMNRLLKIDPNDPEAFDVEPILKKVIQKLKDLDKDKKEENVAIMNQLKALRQKIETMPPMIEKYRTEVKKFSDTKLDQMTVNQFLPSSQQFMEGLKADLEKILKD